MLRVDAHSFSGTVLVDARSQRLVETSGADLELSLFAFAAILLWLAFARRSCCAPDQRVRLPSNEELTRKVVQRTAELKDTNRRLDEEVRRREIIQEQLGETSRSMGTLLANLPGMAYRCRNNEAMSIEYVSQGCLDLIGYTQKEVYDRGLCFGDLIHPEDYPAVQRQIEAAVTHGCPFHLEYRLQRKDDSSAKVMERGVAVTDEDGEATLEGFIFDVTDYRRAEQALRESEQRYRTVVENSGTSVSIVRKDGTIEFVNRTAAQLFGAVPHQLIGKRLTELLPTSQAERLLWKIGRAAENCKAFVDEGEFELPGGRYYLIRRGTPLPDEDGRCDRLLIATTDMTDIQRARSEKTQLEEQFRQAQKMEAIGRLAGGIAHDFNNQLTLIKGYADIVLKRLPEESPLREQVQVISEAARRSAHLTGQLLSFGRKQVLTTEVVQLNDLLREMQKPLARMIGEDIHLTLELDEDLPHVETDPVQVHQALMNLVVNARDAMPTGGRLVLSTRRRTIDDGDMDVDGADGGQFAELAVSDTGAGMDGKTLEHIYEPFFTTKPRGEGTGLGLPMVYGFVKQCHGYLRVESRPGRGTTFRMLLPACEARGQQRREETADEAVSGSGTVLVVEDEPDVRSLVHAILADCGYRVLMAANAEDAVRLGRRKLSSIDLIVSDVVMPGMSGPEVVRRIAGDPPSVPVLYMTGYADEAVVKHGLRGGNVDLVTKPFTFAQLAARVAEIVDRGRSI